MDANGELYGLMVIAREQQAAISAAIEALAAERKEAAAQRSALSREAAELAKAAKEASTDLQKATSGAARQAVMESIKATAHALCGAFGATSQPVLARLSTLTEAAADTKARLCARTAGLAVAAVPGPCRCRRRRPCGGRLVRRHGIHRAAARRDQATDG